MGTLSIILPFITANYLANTKDKYVTSNGLSYIPMCRKDISDRFQRLKSTPMSTTNNCVL